MNSKELKCPPLITIDFKYFYNNLRDAVNDAIKWNKQVYFIGGWEVENCITTIHIASSNDN